MCSEIFENKITFYVSKEGDDSNPGTQTKPFATLEHTQDEVRSQIKQNIDRDLVVVIRGGTYYVNEGLIFDHEDSGSKEHSITYMAYPGEQVSIIGGKKVSNWEPYKDGIWEASIPDEDVPLQVFENGIRLELARIPDQGYFHIEKPVEGKEQTAFVYKSGDLNPNNWNIKDATVFIWPNHDWFSATKSIASIDSENRIITLDSKVSPMKAGNRYFIQNVLALLDRKGECQINSESHKIYVLPRKTPISEQTMVVSTADSLISIHGKDENQLVKNLHFEGLDLSMSNGNVVNIRNAENCSFHFCKIENGYYDGVSIDGYAQNIIVYGNLIRFNGQHGIALSGLPPSKADVNKNNTIENNHIHHCGRLVGHGYGVRIYQSGHNRVIHNHIHHMPRYGTTIKGIRYQVLRKQLEGVRWENRHSFLHSRNNLIAYNHIHHVNQDSQDTGAMESWGPGRDNVYDHNIIHDVGNEQFNLQMGIYLDDATDYFTVTNNIIWGVIGTDNTQCIYAKGIGNKISNNILIIGEENSAAISSLYMAEERADNHLYTRNIYYFEGSKGAIYDFYNWSDDRIGVSDYNLFWKPEGKLKIRGQCPAETLEEWRSILDKKYDQHSIVAEPMFVEPANRNYHLKPESPAFKLGFKDIDTSEIGLKDDFPSRFSR